MNLFEKKTGGPVIPSNGPSIRANKTAFEPLAFLLMVGLFGWFLLKPAYESHVAAGEEIKRLETQKQLIEDKQDKLNSLKRQLTSKKADIEKLEEALPTAVEPAGIYYMVEQLALGVGLLGTSINVTPVPKEIVAGSTAAPFSGKYELRETEVTLRGSGTIDQLQGFLKAIEEAPRLIETTSLEASVANSGQLVFTVQLSAYSYAPIVEEKKGGVSDDK